jgi:TatD DNase family protein
MGYLQLYHEMPNQGQFSWEMTDCHCHLAQQQLEAEVEHIIRRSRQMRVSSWFVCAASTADWPQLERLTVHPGVVPFFGIHPWYSDTVDPAAAGPAAWPDVLRTRLQSHDCCGVGETGLDFTRDNVSRERQLEIFTRHLEIAVSCGVPVTVHAVRAWGALMPLLRHYVPLLPAVIIHSFSASREITREVCALGCYCSFSPALLSPGSERMRNAASCVPAEQLLFETDYPAAPRISAQAGFEPSELSGLLAAAAQLRDVPAEQLAAQCESNARRIRRGCCRSL